MAQKWCATVENEVRGSLMAQECTYFKEDVGLLGGSSQALFWQGLRQKCVWSCSTVWRKGVKPGKPVQTKWTKDSSTTLLFFPVNTWKCLEGLGQEGLPARVFPIEVKKYPDRWWCFPLPWILFKCFGAVILVQVSDLYCWEDRCGFHRCLRMQTQVCQWRLQSWLVYNNRRVNNLSTRFLKMWNPATESPGSTPEVIRTLGRKKNTFSFHPSESIPGALVTTDRLAKEKSLYVFNIKFMWHGGLH